jgi:hypothetical protein
MHVHYGMVPALTYVVSCRAEDGVYTGMFMSGNSVECNDRCHYGIELGPHAWYQSPNIIGGTVTGNTVSGASMLINVDGGGTAAQPISVYGNSYGAFTPNVEYLCKETFPGTRFIGCHHFARLTCVCMRRLAAEHCS